MYEKKIDTVIFDVGGVLLPNYSELIKNDISTSLGIPREDVDRAFKELIPNYLGKGKITEEEFWERFCDLTGCSKEYDKTILLVREMDKRHAPFSFVSDIVRSLKLAGYKLGIISDTIKAHVDCHARHGLYDNFSVKIFSNEVGFRKPDPRIFKLALDKLGSLPEETVYVDDVPVFVEAANELGMNGIVFQNDNQLKRDLEKIGIEFEMIPERKQTNAGAFAIIVTKEGRILLQQRTTSSRILNSGRISVFGGRLSEGEEIMDGLRRELLEELELLIDEYEIEKLGIYQKTSELDGVDDVLHIFIVRNVDAGNLKLHEGESILSVDPVDALNNEKTTRITKLAVEDFVKKEA